MHKRSVRLARSGKKQRTVLLLTVLIGAMSLVGALSYNSASNTSREFAQAEAEKLIRLEEQFNSAKSQEQIELANDIEAVQTAEAKAQAEAAAAAAAIAKKAADEAAAKLAAQKALEEAAKKVAAVVVAKPDPTPIINPVEGSNMKLLGTLSSTAYTHTGNNMANGEYPYVGAVACNLVPLGTTLYVEGYGYFVVKDRIGHSSQLDFFMETYQDCMEWGRRSVKVYVVK